ncbi:MAG: exo-alpha-sialidase [Proteobacteria bacterium]|nr:exo-alpha-sialidase [Pseudomonadota bacterium]
MPKPVRTARHSVIHRDSHAYAAHPHIACLADGSWLAVFNKAPRRALRLHPPQDPLFHNYLIRSVDEGDSWSAPEVVPDYDRHGVECAGLTPLADGSVLLNQWQFRWYPLGAATARADASELIFPERFAARLPLSPELGLAQAPRALLPWARGGGTTWVHRSVNCGRSWSESIAIDTSPFSGGYGMRGGIELPSGEILLPLSDIPHYRRIFLIRSSDGGRQWSDPSLVAAAEGHEFEEPAMIQLANGRLLMLLRDNVSRGLHQIQSEDHGRSWTELRASGIRGYPSHLSLLSDGQVLCLYGHRAPDYSIRAVLSADGGATWDTDDTRVVRGGLPNEDLGYPSAIVTESGEIFAIYYCQDGDGVTGIEATRFCL